MDKTKAGAMPAFFVDYTQQMGRSLISLLLSIPLLLLWYSVRTCSNMPSPSSAPPSPPGNWRMESHDARGTRCASVAGPKTGKLKWKYGKKGGFLQFGGFTGSMSCA